MNKLTPEEKQIITSHSFAQILSSTLNSSGFAELSYCPLQLIADHQLLGHLANNNQILKVVEDQSPVKVIFTGPHGYISPRWHNEQAVPTWNYVTVSLSCKIKLIKNQDEKLKFMEDISHYFDAQWNFNEFNQDKNKRMVTQMLSAITVFTLEIIEVSSKFKLSQNRSLACRKAFQDNLALSGNNELADIQL
ncbi:MAG: FMN-binding negative transcriptional regulator [Colwellia sp.]|nr:FMN-binding negative transcriptional regulator [Colwellia sp.]